MSHYPFTSSTLAIAAFILLGCAGCSPDGGFRQHRAAYQQVLQRVRSGEIKTRQEKGVTVPEGSVLLPCSAQLPPDLQAATSDGQVYISRPSATQFIVVFKTWQGKGFNMDGYLYAASPLSGPEISKDYYGHSVVVVGPMELVLEKRLDQNWYKVSYKLD